MRTLFHQWLCPHSRKIRIAMAEKKLDFKLQVERPWEKRPEFITLSPTQTLPILIDEDQTIVHHHAIAAYLDEHYPERALYSENMAEKNESRHLSAWIDNTLYYNVWMKIIFEKLYKRHNSLGQTEGRVLREGLQQLSEYLMICENLVKTRHWLAGDHLSWADISAGGLFSALDYMGDINWTSFPELKSWYARLKSRPCFKEILSDKVPGIVAAPSYCDLDF